jgi:hypothetical protein
MRSQNSGVQATSPRLPVVCQIFAYTLRSQVVQNLDLNLIDILHFSVLLTELKVKNLRIILDQKLLSEQMREKINYSLKNT